MVEISASLNSALFWSWKERKKKTKKKTIRWNTLLYNSNMDTKSNHFIDINSKNYVLFFCVGQFVQQPKKKKKITTILLWQELEDFFFITIGSNFAIWLASSFFDRNFLHAFLIIPLRSYENIFLEVSTPQIVLCFLYIRVRRRRSNNAFQFDLSPHIIFSKSPRLNFVGPQIRAWSSFTKLTLSCHTSRLIWFGSQLLPTDAFILRYYWSKDNMKGNIHPLLWG